MRLTAIHTLTAALVVAGMTPVIGSPENRPAEVSAADSTVAGPRVILYYFHRTVRCHSCLTIEAYTEKTVQSEFPGELEAGQLEWRPIDVEQPGNEHFQDDYQLEFNSLILAEVTGEAVTSWRNLDQVWYLLDDEEDFEEYVQTIVATALSYPGEGGDSEAAGDASSETP